MAVDAIWHNYHEKIAPACIVWIKAHGNPIDLEMFKISIVRSLKLLSTTRDYGNEEVRERVEVLLRDLSFMSQILEYVGKGETVKVLDIRSRKDQGKRVCLKRLIQKFSNVPVIRVQTGEGCEACDRPKRIISNSATALGGLDTVPSG